MKSTVVVDSGIIVEYLKSGKGALPSIYEKYNMLISTATYTEILASKTFEDTALQKEVIEFIEKYFKVKEVDTKIGLAAARIIREHDLNLAAAYVAATALEGSHQILTDDEKSFNKISGIEFLKI